MTARGYRGDAKTLQSFRLTGLDIAAALTCAALAAAILIGDRLLGN